MSYNRHYKLEPQLDPTQVFTCGVCKERGQAKYKVMASTSTVTYWWTDTVCSETCFNMWLLKHYE